MFYVGQKVVCVDDEAFESDGIKRLIAGRIYTIRDMPLDIGPIGWEAPNYKGSGFIRLAGIFRGGSDTPYSLGRFHPIVESKTDISIFTAMLSPSDQVPA